MDNHAGEQSLRRLRIVEHTYRQGVASLEELSSLTQSSSATIERDVAALRRGGLRISLDNKGQCVVDQRVPGFALRLTAQEAASAWVRRWHCSGCSLLVGRLLHSSTLTTASALLESGLRRFYPQYEVAQVRCEEGNRWKSLLSSGEGRSSDRPRLAGEAERLCNRLRIIDLVETGKARRREELAAILGVADRTIGNDLLMLRRAGIRISYARSRGAYRIETLHTFLKQELSRPGRAEFGAALLMLFRQCENEQGNKVGDEWAGGVAGKISESIHLIFGSRRRELYTALAEFGVDV